VQFRFIIGGESAMPYKLDCLKAPDGTPAVVVSSMQEALPAVQLLRMLKAAFPELYREVWYEIQPVSGNGAAKFELPADLEVEKRE
jgi:hypothetical protein